MAEEIIATDLWVDNFHIGVERLCGSGVVNTTHLMAIQEPSISVTQANVTYTSDNISKNRQEKIIVESG